MIFLSELDILAMDASEGIWGPEYFNRLDVACTPPPY